MRILVADDDRDMQEMYATLLKEHAITICRDGVEAVHEYRKLQADGGVDYVITDYQMPRKNGVVLIMEIRALNPEQKCILVSGDPPKLNSMTKELTGEFPMLQKPFRRADLFALLT
jgi:DNA-binding NtrC family response regulator